MKYLLYITTGLLLGLLPMKAQDNIEFSYDDYQQMVLDSNLQIQAAQSEVEASLYRIEANKRNYLPAIELNAMDIYNNHHSNTDGDLYLKENIFSVNLQATQTIYAGGMVKKNVELAKIMNEAAMAGRDLTAYEISYMSALTYWRAISAKEQLNAWYDYIDTFNEFYATIESKVEDQLLGRNELLIAKVQLNDVKQKVLDAEKQLETSKLNIKQLASLPSDINITLKDSIIISTTSPDSINAYMTALNARPEITYLEKQVEANVQKEKLAKAPYLPSVGAQAQGSYANGLLNTSNGGTYYALTVKATVPITQWGKKKQEVAAQRMMTESAQLNLDDQKIKLEYEIRNAFYNVGQSQKQVVFAEEAVEDALENLDIYYDRYNEGISSIEAVTEAQTFLQQAIILLYNYRLGYQFNVIEYKKATGQLLTNNLSL